MKKLLNLFFITVIIIGGISLMENSQNANAKSTYESSITDKTSVRASHILVATEEEALNLKKEIEAGQISFSEAAAKYSKCPSGVRGGGDLGFFGKNQMVKPFEEAAFSLPINVISEPIQTQFGYHLIQVTDIK